jgi:hypothetical protein
LSTNAAKTAKRPEFLEKMMATAGPRHEPEVEEAERTLKEMRGAIPTPMLDLIFRDGKMRSFSYAFLSEVEFEPGDTLTLKFTSGAAVVVEGRNLVRHRQQVRLHRADEIRAFRAQVPLRSLTPLGHLPLHRQLPEYHSLLAPERLRPQGRQDESPDHCSGGSPRQIRRSQHSGGLSLQLRVAPWHSAIESNWRRLDRLAVCACR